MSETALLIPGKNKKTLGAKWRSSTIKWDMWWLYFYVILIPQVSHYLWVYLWGCFYMKLTFESTD